MGVARHRAVGATALALGVALFVGSCASQGEDLAQPTPSVSVIEPSPDPNPSPTAPDPSASPSPAGWELSRFDHPDGVYSISFPKGWVVDDQGGESQSVVAKNFETSDSHGFTPADVKLHVGLTIEEEVVLEDARSTEADGLSGRYRIYDAVDSRVKDSDGGVELVASAVFRLQRPVGRLTGISVVMSAGSDEDDLRDLFFAILDSLRVHQ